MPCSARSSCTTPCAVNEYDDAYDRTHQHDRGPELNAGWQGEMTRLQRVFDRVPVHGEVVELAAGTGAWTERLVELFAGAGMGVEVETFGSRFSLVSGTKVSTRATRSRCPGASTRVHPWQSGRVTTWSSPDKVDEYVGRIGTVPQRLAGEAVLAEIMPPAPQRALDLGCGDGRLAAVILDARPDVEQIVAVDASPPMLERARARFANDTRVELRTWDLREPIGELGAFDLVVSGFAIHHLDDERKQALFGEIAELLRPGGMFCNLEVVASPTPELHAAFRAAIGREEDDPEDRLVAVETQLGWMRAARFEQVDCIWKWRGFALLVGSAPRRSNRA